MHPLSPDLHPPWPLQVFCPLQEWVPLSASVWIDVPAVPVLLVALAASAAEPLRSPATAAVRIAVLVVFFMVYYVSGFLVRFDAVSDRSWIKGAGIEEGS